MSNIQRIETALAAIDSVTSSNTARPSREKVRAQLANATENLRLVLGDLAQTAPANTQAATPTDSPIGKFANQPIRV
jgi:hypothetical protein